MFFLTVYYSCLHDNSGEYFIKFVKPKSGFYGFRKEKLSAKLKEEFPTAEFGLVFSDRAKLGNRKQHHEKSVMFHCSLPSKVLWVDDCFVHFVQSQNDDTNDTEMKVYLNKPECWFDVCMTKLYDSDNFVI